jgi:hypothetical protein
VSPSDVCDDCRFRFPKITGKPGKQSTITGIECAFHRDSTQNLNFHCWQKNERDRGKVYRKLYRNNFSNNFFRIFFEIFFSIFFLFFGLYNFLAAQNRPPYSVSQNTRLFGPRNVYSPIALGTNTYSFNIYKYRSHHWLIFGRDVSLGNQRSH